MSELVTSQLDHSRPLWEMHLIERPNGGRALLVRVHHCIVDGIALARVIVSLTDEAREYEDSSPQGYGFAVAGEGSEAVRKPAEHTLHARELVGRTPAGARALAKLLFTPADARTALRGKLGVPRRVAWTSQLELARVKATARAQGATVNDVLLAAVSGALRRYTCSTEASEPRARSGRWYPSTCAHLSSRSRASSATASGWCSSRCPWTWPGAASAYKSSHAG